MVDVQAQIEAVDRAVAVEEIDGRSMRVQTLGQTYRASIDDVWHALTTLDRIPRWFLPISGELSVGGRYQLEGNAGGVVEECSPPVDGVAQFRVTWEFGGGPPTWLTIKLSSLAAESTRLDLIFTGNADELPEEMWQQFGPAATGMGWDSGLLGLALYVENASDGISPEEAAAWVMTDEGKQFMRLAADAWAQAHIADGGEPEAAMAAATTTYLMYTGQTEMPA
jgi:uncharacterized protein YndB with AHSA1/START domain